ncbi:DNA alkylation repair protein [Paenibacillus sp. MBLB4367]|uniref:DNA alkylation repair protein n=1 Tax=Paenibacillus sp. MBLB4367 TaxID=3384767 RepID=UPI00390830BC
MINAYAEGLQNVMRMNADVQAAGPMQAYMKHQFRFLGIPSPKRKELIRGYAAECGWPEGDELCDAVIALWELPEREYHYLALDLLAKKAKKLRKQDIGLLETLVTDKSWWDTVDAIASILVGSLFEAYPELIVPYIDKWLSSGNMWLQRTAILFQLKYKKKTDVPLLFRCIETGFGSREFFIQKAIGWALREYAKTDPAAVIAFAEAQPLAALSRREALKGILKQAKG